MIWVQTVLKEIWALFVDDGMFAFSILAWLAIGCFLSRLGLPPTLICIGFFAGFAGILYQSSRMRAKKP